ncbi:hypothetical protein TRFO_42837 [Tritrichomonas foetus]|uniref:Rab-GAP TBC domain-containing protein n=1 Tax=Tritrichomonas foetus TaxID=1144522 RepID=A0A1J4KZ62_9EUKA|nr:hypothetical protein TRFO_42837 [Tritrichomonas foetus]|eukprot:OHT14877.1 hypothetical protein TRFO_42837 [Tritrichomonas foetus]
MLREEEENKIRAALIAQCGNIFDFDDAKSFLLNDNIKKNISTRLISWLITFHLISPMRARWPSSLLSLKKSYQMLLIKYPEKQIDLIEKEFSHVIKNDTLRTEPWFRKLCVTLGIPPSFSNDAVERSQRILSLIMLESSNLQYVQGQDRFIWISFLLSQFFSFHADLSIDFSEAIAFHLGKSFITLIELSRKLENYSYVENHFTYIDKMVEEEAPEIWLLLKESQNSAIHYALKWELTLFAEEHEIFALFYLWDQILGRLHDFDEFIRCLCVAHVKQVPVPREKDEMAQTIQRYKNWNVEKIVEDAKKMMAENQKGACCDFLLIQVYNWLEGICGFHRLG